MKTIKSISYHSDTYVVGEAYKPPSFTDGATVTSITDNRNAFRHNDGGFEVRFDTGDILRIHSNDVVVHFEPME
ncbi:hypothetical protein HOO54_02770 [Bacillus sp. WMMC1349]|uniref:hypothetical protein n=1 Tax=Bacillus sp. WMMC1349 TaxID=2736254 RepID=UPI001553DCEC|nr:hypothetical protein [Bacillus sp. WMMC1349]NPC91203.1 hypothetical protein [Bacillus sp. WMMC1349]